jgi:hypothetical protein
MIAYRHRDGGSYRRRPDRATAASEGATIEKFPLHFQGEVLAGLAQTAQRTGRNDESGRYLDMMLTVLPDTPYEDLARQWKSDPSSAAKTNLTCKTCHGAGRLSSRLEALKK